VQVRPDERKKKTKKGRGKENRAAEPGGQSTTATAPLKGVTNRRNAHGGGAFTGEKYLIQKVEQLTEKRGRNTREKGSHSKTRGGPKLYPQPKGCGRRKD